jgi:hypothetical protein
MATIQLYWDDSDSQTDGPARKANTSPRLDGLRVRPPRKESLYVEYSDSDSGYPLPVFASPFICQSLKYLIFGSSALGHHSTSPLVFALLWWTELVVRGLNGQLAACLHGDGNNVLGLQCQRWHNSPSEREHKKI